MRDIERRDPGKDLAGNGERTLRSGIREDAGEFLDDAFDSQYASDGYFTDFYEERIKTLHPQSRFGVFPAAPLFADEYSQLNSSLETLYDFLLTGHVYREWRGR